MKRFTEQTLFCIVALSMLLLSVASCVKEDNDNCDTTLSIVFSYTLNEDFECRFMKDASNVRLYFYNTSDGLLAFTREVEIASLIDQTYTTKIPQGEYTIVGWGNMDDDIYQCPDTSLDVDNALLATKMTANNEIEYHDLILLHGEETLSASFYGDITLDYPMVRVTNNITINLERVPPATTRDLSNPQFNVNIGGCNNTYNFHRECPSGQGFSTYLYTCPEATTNKLLFNVNRLTLDSDLVISITQETGTRATTTWVTDNVVEQILSQFSQISSDEDLLRYSDYEFTYEFNGTFELVSIKVGPWEYVPEQNTGM